MTIKTLVSPILVLLLFVGAGLLAPTRAYAQAPNEPDQQQKAMYYSLYYEDFKNENYESSLENLRWILKNAPGFPRNNDRNFERAVKVFREIAVKQTDPAKKQAYFDSALVIFDTAVSRLKDAEAEVSEYDWIFAKGKFIQENAEHLPNLQPQVGDLYRQAFDMDPTKMQAYYVNYIVADFAKKDDKQSAVDFLETVESTFPGEEEFVTLVANWRNSLFTSPDERYEFVSNQLEKNPDDCDLVLEKLELAMDLGYRDDVYELSEQVLGCEQSARTFRIIGKMKLDDGEAEEAFALFERALEQTGGTENAREIYYNMGIAQQQLGRLSRARTFFRQALQADASYGPALMAIGDLYVTAIANCGSFEREDRAVYWLVTDYYDRARSVDPTIASAAQRKSKQYRAYYPDQEALFFKGWQPGQRYMVNYGCYSWIGEATTVKSP